MSATLTQPVLGGLRPPLSEGEASGSRAKEKKPLQVAAQIKGHGPSNRGINSSNEEGDPGK